MADRPLRPAKDHRLGEPLPHQQPNPAQAYPSAVYAFMKLFGVLSQTEGEIPTYYSPVRYSKKNRVQLACVKRIASVHSGPGSNPIVFLMKFFLDIKPIAFIFFTYWV